MMAPGRMLRSALANTFRDPRAFWLATFGIFFGIWLFVLVSAFAVRALGVVYKAFPLEDLEVVAPRASLAGLDLTKTLTDETVTLLGSHPAAASALPRMAMNFPASGFGTFEGNPLAFEVGGFADGIDPKFVADDAKLATMFRDWELGEPGPACEPRPVGDASGWKNSCPQPDRTYCDAVDRRCHHRVPVIISPFLVELYNSQFAPTHGLPFIDANLADFIVKRGGYGRMSFSIALGDTMLSGLPSAAVGGPKRIVEAVVVGVSPKAMRLGITIPIGYVERFGRDLRRDSKKTYSSIVVRLRDASSIPEFTQFVMSNELRLEDSTGEQFAKVIRWVSYIVFFFCGVILLVSCINIAYILFTQVAARRREIGLLRAVGATRRDVSRLVRLEAAIIGLAGGVIGLVLALITAPLINWLFAVAVPQFPLKPSNIFDFRWWFCAGAVAVSTLFCVLGGLGPSMRAARVHPANALAEK